MSKLFPTIMISFFMLSFFTPVSYACEEGDYKVSIVRDISYVPESDTMASLSIFKSDSREILAEDIFSSYYGGMRIAEHSLFVAPDGLELKHGEKNRFELSFLPSYHMSDLCRLVFRFASMDRVVPNVSLDSVQLDPEYVVGYNSVDIPDLQPMEMMIVFRFHYIANSYLYFIVQRV